MTREYLARPLIDLRLGGCGNRAIAYACGQTGFRTRTRRTLRPACRAGLPAFPRNSQGFSLRAVKKIKNLSAPFPTESRLLPPPVARPLRPARNTSVRIERVACAPLPQTVRSGGRPFERKDQTMDAALLPAPNHPPRPRRALFMFHFSSIHVSPSPGLPGTLQGPARDPVFLNACFAQTQTHSTFTCHSHHPRFSPPSPPPLPPIPPSLQCPAGVGIDLN